MAAISKPSLPSNWTSILFGVLLFAYLFFVTVRGDLAKFLGIFGLAGSTGGASQAPATGTLFGQNSGSVPAIGGSGFGTLPNITGGSGAFAGGVDTGLAGATGPLDTGWMAT